MKEHFMFRYKGKAETNTSQNCFKKKEKLTLTLPKDASQKCENSLTQLRSQPMNNLMLSILLRPEPDKPDRDIER
jgi:hypothetical protein